MRKVKFGWWCRCELGWGQDYECCGARFRKPFRTRKEAERAAQAHQYKTGHEVMVGEVQ